ncbi:hypothetical protein GALMADRAFT_270708 [Galerina marginata CBS 339.88]|uniref:Uncharacterized protein n=1 Tax=Galerina marginata (strain CBS 339.88) TaxID=685588 RepID=A0A067SMQ2_GALM3|nr:hypothetical protein GALMADRAFT_270708 [Galerina marginata CBS 339.88]
MYNRTIVLDIQGKKYEVDLPDTALSLQTHITRVRTEVATTDVERPATIKLLVFLPERLRHLYKKEELYTPGFADRNLHLTLSVDDTTYIAVDRVEIKNWEEAREVEYLARGAPWLIVHENSMNGKHVVE